MARLVLLSIAAALMWSAAAAAGCVATKKHPTCVDLSAVPNIGQQVIGTETPAPRAAKEPPPALPVEKYQGPRLGFSNAVRRAPEIGYRWDID